MTDKTTDDSKTIDDNKTTDTNKTTNLKTLHPQGMCRAKDILALIPINRTTLWRMVNNGRFPKPTRLSSNMVVWKNADVLAWIDEQGGNE